MSAAPARSSLAPIIWAGGVGNGRLAASDRRRMPKWVRSKRLETLAEVIAAFQDGVVAGVGAVAQTAAFAVALHAFRQAEIPPQGRPSESLEASIAEAVATLQAATSDKVPAQRAIGRMRECFDRHVGKLTAVEIAARLLMEAKRIQREMVELSERIAVLGAKELPESGTIITIGASGALAHGGSGTALAAIVRAVQEGKTLTVTVIAGSDGGTTALELEPRGIAVTECDLAAAAQLFRNGKIAAVMAGADRVTAGGDAIGTTGTYALVTLARAHGVPVFIAAPYTFFDFSIEHGDELGDVDVTPATAIDGVVTGRGVIRRPTRAAVEGMMRDREDPGVG
jgi:methylthioribose-1-phosphate isomerase